jgi:hypothetical protein
VYSWSTWLITFLSLISDLRPERTQIAKQLKNLQVYTARKVQQKLSVQLGHNEVSGCPRPGKVALHSENDILQIYLLKKDLNSAASTSYVELVDQLAAFCGFGAEEKSLLFLVIFSNEHRIIKDQFDKHGIRALRADEEVGEDFYVPERQSNKLDSGSRPGEDFDIDEIVGRMRLIAEGFYTGKNIRIFSGEGMKLSKVARGGKVDRSALAASDGEPLDIILASSDDDSSTDSDSSRGARYSIPGQLCVIASAHEKRPRKNRKQHRKIDEKLAAASEAFVSHLNNRLSFISISSNSSVLCKVSAYLGYILQGSYKPDQHWTRKIREQVGSGYGSSQSGEDSLSAFTIPDRNGVFTKFLLDNGCSEAKAWLERPPVYHLEVTGTRGDERSKFPISNSQIARVRWCLPTLSLPCFLQLLRLSCTNANISLCRPASIQWRNTQILARTGPQPPFASWPGFLGWTTESLRALSCPFWSIHGDYILRMSFG